MDYTEQDIKEYYEWEAQVYDQQKFYYENKNKIRSNYHNRRKSIIIEEITKLQPSTIIDVGCSEGYYLSEFNKIHSINFACGVDISHSYIKKAKNRVRSFYVVCNAENLPFRDKSFDLVLCSEMIEHTLQPVNVIKECARICSRYVVLSVPTDLHLPWIRIPVKLLQIDYGRDGKLEKDTEKKKIFDNHLHHFTPKQIVSWASNFSLIPQSIIAVWFTMMPYMAFFINEKIPFLYHPLCLTVKCCLLLEKIFCHIYPFNNLGVNTVFVLSKNDIP